MYEYVSTRMYYIRAFPYSALRNESEESPCVSGGRRRLCAQVYNGKQTARRDFVVVLTY